MRGVIVLRWVLGVAVAALVLAVPLLHYRATYEHARRLRLVADQNVKLPDGRIVHHTLYRSGQLTANGFRDAHRRYQFKTVVNLQEEARDPKIPLGFLNKTLHRQSDVLADLKVTYIPLDGGVLDHPEQEPGARPLVIDQFLEILDRPENHPVLFHCKAGLHRTGLMTAIYRMEYERRTPEAAVEELKANGFGTFAATDANFYLDRFVYQFKPGLRRTATRPTPTPKTPGEHGP
jgi:protein tyrosine/serine phosphatase